MNLIQVRIETKVKSAHESTRVRGDRIGLQPHLKACRCCGCGWHVEGGAARQIYVDSFVDSSIQTPANLQCCSLRNPGLTTLLHLYLESDIRYCASDVRSSRILSAPSRVCVLTADVH